MDSKRYHFVMLQDVDLIFCTVPPVKEFIPSRDCEPGEYYLLDIVGEYCDEEDNDLMDDLSDEEEMCTLLDFTHCADGFW